MTPDIAAALNRGTKRLPISAENLSRIHRGAQWLDDNYPGWREHVDLATLDMSSDVRCILGQQYLWHDAFDARAKKTSIPEAREFFASLGLTSGVKDGPFDEAREFFDTLTADWKTYIQETSR